MVYVMRVVRRGRLTATEISKLRLHLPRLFRLLGTYLNVDVYYGEKPTEETLADVLEIARGSYREVDYR